MGELDTKQQDALWDFYQNEASDVFSKCATRLEWVVNQIPSQGKALDIGVGTGVLEGLALSKGVDIYALDPSQQSVNNVKEKFKLGDKAQVGYADKMPFSDNFFDAVIMSEVMEHLAPEVLTPSLVDVSRVLKPGGLFIGTVPARENLQDSTVICPHCTKRFHRWGHEQSFTIASMQTLMGKYFETVLIKERIFFSKRELQWINAFNFLIQPLVAWAGLKRPSFNIIVVARKRH